MFNTTQDEQNQKMVKALQEHYANRDKPKPPAPVNEQVEVFKGLQDYAARENAQRMEELNEHFRIINSKRANKSK